jgi:hypothetical protein
MKKFSEFLAESVRNYEYQIKFSFKPSDDVLNKIESALGKYQLVDISKPKSKPISRQDKSFPGIENPEVFTVDIATAYPSTTEMIRNTVASIGLELQNVAVVSSLHQDTVDAEENLIDTNDQDGVALLNREEPNSEKSLRDDLVNQTYVDKLVKNSIGSTDQIIPKEFKKNKAETLNDFPTGKNSAMGSVKSKLPSVKSFAR